METVKVILMRATAIVTIAYGVSRAAAGNASHFSEPESRHHGIYVTCLIFVSIVVDSGQGQLHRVLSQETLPDFIHACST
jgi:hypothetical protein